MAPLSFERAEQLVGFDVRIAPHALPAWTEDRRGLYMLRDDIAFGLSVDALVWPRPAAAPLRDCAAATTWAESVGLSLSLESDGDDAWSVAITLMFDSLSADDRAQYAGWVTEIGIIDDRWELLGFDVADLGLLSGLLNCGYLPEDQSLRSWATKLNHYHLFRAPDDARAFCGITNQRVPEHGSFAVFGLYRVRATAVEVPTGSRAHRVPAGDW